MKQVFRYQPKWLAVVSGILGTLLGGILLWGANGMGWWLGLTILIASIYGTAYQAARKNEFISIDDEIISFKKIRISVAQIAKVERLSVNETIHYKTMLRDGTEVFLPAPYWTADEREFWAALKKISSGAINDGHSPSKN